jgi:hypothetical protein
MYVNMYVALAIFGNREGNLHHASPSHFYAQPRTYKPCAFCLQSGWTSGRFVVVNLQAFDALSYQASFPGYVARYCLLDTRVCGVLHLMMLLVFVMLISCLQLHANYSALLQVIVQGEELADTFLVYMELHTISVGLKNY